MVLKLFLVSDLPVQILHAPHDDALYVERGLRLLTGEGFGAYDNRTLVKYPGISLWLAGVRELGIPFLISINALYIGAGAYLLAALLRCGVNRWIGLAAFALYLFNPITFGFEWIRVMREPLDTGLLVLMVAAMGHTLALLHQGRLPWGHLAVFSAAFAFSMFVREENRLLWALLAFFVAALFWVMIRARRYAGSVAFVAAALLVPAALAKGYELGLRAYVEQRYGLPILHEFGEGEFPRLLAAIRSVQSSKDNRLVMVSKETLQRLRREVPEFAPVIDRLPEPGKGTFSCELQGVCSETSNGWMPFWIKDEAFHAGLTPNLIAAQEYFRKIRLGIERACSEKRLQCVEKGEGLVPPMELRWTRALVAEGWRVAKMALAPDSSFISEVPALYDVSLELGRVFQAVTMTHNFDTQRQAALGSGPAGPLFTNAISAAGRAAILVPYQMAAAALLLFAFAALAFRLWIADRAPLGPLALLGLVVALYALGRLTALSYLAVYFGPFTGRIVFSTHAVTVALSLPFIAETLEAWRLSRETSKA